MKNSKAEQSRRDFDELTKEIQELAESIGFKFEIDQRKADRFKQAFQAN